MEKANQYGSGSNHSSGRQSFGDRAKAGWETARREATAPRIAAAVAVGAAAAAYGLLRNPDRRERLRQSAHDLRGRMNFGSHNARSTPQAPAIG